MKTRILLTAVVAMGLLGGLASCNDYLDKEPMSEITPDHYFDQESHLEAYANGLYSSVLPTITPWTYGMYGGDINTDNMVSNVADNIYIKGEWRTSMSDDNYTFTNINTINFFFERVLPKYEAGEISGNQSSIRHFIGEMYFLRAYTYFTLLQRYGDFPIITTCLPENIDILSEASKRMPCNEVARFIISDLDKAYDFLNARQMSRTRINADVALLIKSRVALYMGTWLRNFAGTAFVPNGEGWPGAQKDYNKNYQYPTGSVEAESKWFLQQAMDAADKVASSAILMDNTGIVPQTEGASIAALEAENPWLAMFGTLDLSSYGEVMLWCQYNRGLGISHNIVVYAQKGNCTCGSTRGLVDAYLCKDGLPIYASPLYKGDTELSLVRQNRDPRLFVLLKEPGQKNILVDDGVGTHGVAEEPYPKILESDDQNIYTTGYALRKGNYYGSQMAGNGDNYTAMPIFRSNEALLNYIEAQFEHDGALNGKSEQYWKQLRQRNQGMETDFNLAIAATDMNEEAKGDWGAYTAGKLIDPVRYNIRRERRCELIGESFRMMDLKRWRSLDQLITTKYHVEGFHIWGTPMQQWYDQTELKATISSPERSSYMRPFEAKMNNAFEGLTWSMAHYLRPMPIYQMMLTSPDGVSVSESPIYQNPYWPTEPNQPAIK